MAPNVTRRPTLAVRLCPPPKPSKSTVSVHLPEPHVRFYSNPFKKIKLESSFHSSQNCTPLRGRNGERARVRNRLGFRRRLGRWPSAKNQRSLQGPLGSSAVCLLWPASAERAPTRLSPETQSAAARLPHVACCLQPAAPGCLATAAVL